MCNFLAREREGQQPLRFDLVPAITLSKWQIWYIMKWRHSIRWNHIYIYVGTKNKVNIVRNTEASQNKLEKVSESKRWVILIITHSRQQMQSCPELILQSSATKRKVIERFIVLNSITKVDRNIVPCYKSQLVE